MTGNVGDSFACTVGVGCGVKGFCQVSVHASVRMCVCVAVVPLQPLQQHMGQTLPPIALPWQTGWGKTVASLFKY